MVEHIISTISANFAIKNEKFCILMVSQEYNNSSKLNLISTTSKKYPFVFESSKIYLAGLDKILNELVDHGHMTVDFAEYIKGKEELREARSKKMSKKKLAVIRLFFLSWITKLVAYPERFKRMGEPQRQAASVEYDLDEIVKYFFLVSEFSYENYYPEITRFSIANEAEYEFEISPHEDIEQARHYPLEKMYRFIQPKQRKLFKQALFDCIRDPGLFKPDQIQQNIKHFHQLSLDS